MFAKCYATFQFSDGVYTLPVGRPRRHFYCLFIKFLRTFNLDEGKSSASPRLDQKVEERERTGTEPGFDLNYPGFSDSVPTRVPSLILNHYKSFIYEWRKIPYQYQLRAVKGSLSPILLNKSHIFSP